MLFESMAAGVLGHTLGFGSGIFPAVQRTNRIDAAVR